MKRFSNVKIKLKIADIIIEMHSKFGLEQFTAEEQQNCAAERFNNFFYKGRGKPHIRIKVEIARKLPKINDTKNVFVTYHFQDGSENWRLLKKANVYLYKSPLESKNQLAIVNEDFNRIKIYLLPKKDKGAVWNYTDIIYDFLQILLINYLAQRGFGIFVHSVGIKDLNGEGLIFAGKSGAGKSTTAKLWHTHSKAMILNDDRIIVRKHKENFFMHGCPWHGEFSDYLASRIESALLKKLIFIHHATKNTVRMISQKKAFSLLYPALFPTFWNKDHLENIVSFCQDLVRNVSCYRLGFKNDKKVIGFVRNVNR